MNYEWNLDILYKGTDDPKFISDLQELDTKIEEIILFADQLAPNKEAQTIEEILRIQEDYSLLFGRLYSYVGLRQTVNTSDAEIVSLVGTLMQKNSQITKPLTLMKLYIANCKDLEKYIEENEFLQEYKYLLEKIKEDATYTLSEDIEGLFAQMDISGGSAWGDLQSSLTSTLEVEYNGEMITLSEVRNLAYDKDASVRKAAYEAELAAYDKIKDSIAFSLNNIKSQVILESNMRGHASPLDMTLYQSDMSRKTLDAMFEAMDAYMPKFREYLKRKGELLGHENGLPFYDLFAPIGETSTRYEVDEAKDFLVDHFSKFSTDLSTMVEEAFDEEWIDFFPRKGKVGGAFCWNLPAFKQSRVLSNYGYGIGDVVTLAHELGHAYHGKMIEDHRPLNTDYSMPVAETASTFNENLILNAAIEVADKEEKIALIENQLQDLTQIIVDIYSRFLFEQAVFEGRDSKFMFADDLSQMMLDAQLKTYGDGLDPESLHQYMWICKGHYYSSGLSFYNFPYAFGGLFARGLIVKYQEQGEAFVPKYQALLKATTVSSVEDVAKLADIDLTDVHFWKSSLQTASDRIDEFLELTK